jgi:hypothetical protein
MTTIRTYTELSKLRTFRERYNYLKLNGIVGVETFGFDRYLNQIFYQSKRWREVRNYVIIRDNGCDLGVEGYEIHSGIIIHHMNPITLQDIELESEFLIDPEYLICTVLNTHNAIHYGNENLLYTEPVMRTRFDTCPWKR